jgi:hypothetical protein
MYALSKPDVNATMLERLHFQHQALKYASRFDENDPNFFVYLSKIFSDPSLPLEFNDRHNVKDLRSNHSKSKMKEWLTTLINQTFMDILRKIIADVDIPAIIFWEMGNFYDVNRNYSDEDLENIKSWAISKIAQDQLGPNKSLVSLKVFVQGKHLYFCIPLPLLDRELAVEALSRAKPIQSHSHQRSPERLNSLYENQIPFNTVRKLSA